MTKLLTAARADAAAAGIIVAVSDSRDGSTHTLLSAPVLPVPIKAAKLAAIERGRVAFGLSIEQLAVEAQVTRAWYSRIQRDPARASDRVVARLAAALKRLRDGKRDDEALTASLVEATYGGFLAAVCQLMGLDVAEVRASDPRAGKTADVAWRAAARARQLALYLTNVSLGVRQRVLARVVGLTPAAVCLALRTIEDLRDDPAFDQLVEAAARAVTGRVA